MELRLGFREIDVKEEGRLLLNGQPRHAPGPRSPGTISENDIAALREQGTTR